MSSWADLDIENPSFWPLIGTQVATTGGGGSGAIVFAVTVNGVITSLNIIEPGTGYTSNFTATITGTGTGAGVTLTVGGGGVTGYTGLVGGVDYKGTSPAWKLNIAANVWSELLASIAVLRAGINANLQAISNIGALSTGYGGSVTLGAAGAGASQNSGTLNLTSTSSGSVTQTATIYENTGGNLVVVNTSGSISLNPGSAGVMITLSQSGFVNLLSLIDSSSTGRPLILIGDGTYGLTLGHTNNGAANYGWISYEGLNPTSGGGLIITSAGWIAIGTVTPTSPFQVVGLPSYANNSAAVSGGLSSGAFYHNGDNVCVVHT